MPRFPLKLFLKDRWILGSFLSAFLLNFFLWIYLALAIKSAAETVFLHYTVHFGVDLIGPRGQIFSLPLLGFILILLNFLLAYFIYNSHKGLGLLTAAATPFVQIFLWVAGVFLVFLNR